MTWIVGTLTPFGLGIVASDIRVTFTDGREVDCLQKIHPVGGGLLAGFAGSVRIGFALLQALANESAHLTSTKAWNLTVISNTWWPRLARHVYSSASKSERDLSSKIILAGSHPNKDEGPFPRIELFEFSAPDFQPKKAIGIASIGCGARSVGCMTVVENAFAKMNPEFLMLFQAGHEAVAAAVDLTLQDAIRENPVHGVSPLFQVGIVSRRLCRFVQRENFLKEDGTHAQFPELARDYDSMLRLCEKNDFNPVGAVC